MKIGNILYRLLVFGLTVTLIVSGSFVARYVIDSLQQKEEYDELAVLMEQARSETRPQANPVKDVPISAPAANAPASTEPTEPTEPVMLPEMAAVYEKNPDTVGWLKIEGTPVNYPVMQSPDRTDFYLKHNFSGQASVHGCLYARESCDVFTPSDNVTIYGHHMKDGSMFGSLKRYTSQSFWEKYRTVQFDTLYERHTYTIFAVFTTTASVGEGFGYHRFENAIDEADFNDFITQCKQLSLIDTGITPEYGDKLICLSTCEYTHVNGRLVVVAVRDPEVISTDIE